LSRSGTSLFLVRADAIFPATPITVHAEELIFFMALVIGDRVEPDSRRVSRKHLAMIIPSTANMIECEEIFIRFSAAGTVITE